VAAPVITYASAIALEELAIAAAAGAGAGAQPSPPHLMGSLQSVQNFDAQHDRVRSYNRVTTMTSSSMG
jgi:hypothetical protein